MAAADAWTARIGAALCLASRWLAGGALALTACAVLAAPYLKGAALAMMSLAAAFGALQLYLAVRIEFDRAIFAAAAQEGFAGFDEALGRLGWRSGADAARTPEARVAGLARLVRYAGGLLVGQLALLLAAAWLR